ncbi:hypothetical protein [Paraburkholderia sp. J7]|uniref:hypothetical protein n=1 Tax=Paraburkholderia sp. J7 TaxID=2805438 RepID=UPI002AB6AAAE|nr:hypothetical protein [Paraburkholderia sp. J7]
MMRKYLINTTKRVATFFGNAIQETQWFGKLRENDSTRWYYPWDGRGFLQLTLATNYIKYWDFRGRASQISADTRNRLKAAEVHANQDHAHAIQYFADTVSGVTPVMLAWRENLCPTASADATFSEENKLCAADSAGFYWAMMRMARYADTPMVLERRTVMATAPSTPNHAASQNHPVIKTYYHSNNFRDASASVNYPVSVGNPSISFNGDVDRCIPFAQSLAVVGQVWFPSENGLIDFPEGR